jgi:hypothetical protein
MIFPLPFGGHKLRLASLHRGLPIFFFSKKWFKTFFIFLKNLLFNLNLEDKHIFSFIKTIQIELQKQLKNYLLLIFNSQEKTHLKINKSLLAFAFPLFTLPPFGKRHLCPSPLWPAAAYADPVGANRRSASPQRSSPPLGGKKGERNAGLALSLREKLRWAS